GAAGAGFCDCPYRATTNARTNVRRVLRTNVRLMVSSPLKRWRQWPPSDLACYGIERSASIRHQRGTGPRIKTHGDRLPAMKRPIPSLVLSIVALACSAFGQQSSTAALKLKPASASADVSSAAAEVLEFERAMEAAVVRGDVAYVDRVSAPDLS